MNKCYYYHFLIIPTKNPQFKKNQISYSALPYKAYDFFPPSAKLDDWKPPVMGSLLVGFGLKSNNNFNDLLHDPDVVGPWYREGNFIERKMAFIL